jgi:hypothetical protein
MRSSGEIMARAIQYRRSVCLARRLILSESLKMKRASQSNGKRREKNASVKPEDRRTIAERVGDLIGSVDIPEHFVESDPWRKSIQQNNWRE